MTKENELLAKKVWEILVECATKQKTIQYASLSALMGKLPVDAGELLEPIQKYCQARPELPLLNVLAHDVNGKHGDGFAGREEDIPGEIEKVYAFDWHSKPNPFDFNRQFPTNYPDEILEEADYLEGAKTKVFVNAYERSPHARKRCILHYGLTCQVCDFDFEKVYGNMGRDFIHVHHIVKISESGAEYTVNPITDLIPVCPNCHAMLHKNEGCSVEQLREVIAKNKKKAK